ncbi:cytochrome P450 [Mycena filopes]|nr:cytochrome P450 [Mycena filopes]
MNILDLPVGICVAALGGLVVVVYGFKRRRARLPLPPGPRKLPLVGNLFDLPPAFEWETYLKWSRQFNSDIIHLDLAGTSLIVLSSLEATDDLLDKRSLIYSDRAHLPMLIDLMGWGFHFSLMKYGENWRNHRRLFSHGFSAANSGKFHPRLTTATHTLLHNLLLTPTAFRRHIKQMAGEVIIGAAYGIDVRAVDDPYIALAERAVQSAGEASIPGRFLVPGRLPLVEIRTGPGAGFKRKAAAWRQIAWDLQEVPFAEVRRQVAAGTATHSFAGAALQALDSSSPSKSYYDETTIKGAAASTYAAGSDTTSIALLTFLLAMLAQARAQAEIDLVTGGSRLPQFGDEERMPYVGAVVKEVFRWRSVTPIVYVPYKGYRIPPGSIVIGNVWALLHHEETYPDPHTFTPERFLEPAVRDPQSAFGFGRRYSLTHTLCFLGICPGRALATASLWLTIASILATFNITKAASDEEGKVYVYSPGFLSAPLPFECEIRPRSEEARALIRSE